MTIKSKSITTSLFKYILKGRCWESTKQVLLYRIISQQLLPAFNLLNVLPILKEKDTSNIQNLNFNTPHGFKIWIQNGFLETDRNVLRQQAKKEQFLHRFLLELPVGRKTGTYGGCDKKRFYLPSDLGIRNIYGNT